jgi:hypothetical protein
MPIETGPISPRRAARISAELANEVVFPLLDSRKTWEGEGAAFCVQLVAGMQARFDDQYPGVGANVQLDVQPDQ